jgi:hypothetical protein
MDTHLDSHRHLFLVRLWLETNHNPSGQQTPAPGDVRQQWRGSVVNVITGQRLYFTSLADMSDFISFQLEKK